MSRARSSTSCPTGSSGSTTTSWRPRRSTPTRRRRSSRPGAGRGDARRAGLHGARPRDRRPAGRLAGRARLRVGARRREHRARRWRCPGTTGRRAPVARRWTTSAMTRSTGRPTDPPVARGDRPTGSTRGSSGPSASASGRTSSTRPGSSSCAARSSTSPRAGARRPSPRLTPRRCRARRRGVPHSPGWTGSRSSARPSSARPRRRPSGRRTAAARDGPRVVAP